MAASTLFVVIDPNRDQQPALEQAANIARQMDAHIHAYCCDYRKDLSQFSSRSEAKRHTLEAANDKVVQLLAPLKQEGLSVEVEVAWNQFWDRSAVHAAARTGADLMITCSYARDNLPSSRSGYYLLRHSSCPVLLVRAPKARPVKTVLAAVAIEDGDHKHDILNDRILAHSKRICRATQAQLHLVAALEGRPDIAHLLNILVDEDQIITSDQALLQERFGVELDHIHVESGAADVVIADTTKTLNPDLVVIGTLGREGFAGALIGNTAERILSRLDTDILVIN